MANSAYPMARFLRFSTEDVDQARDQVAQVYCDHRLTPVKSAQRIEAWQTLANLGKISIGAIGYGVDIEIAPGALEDFYVVMLPYQGHASISNGKQQTIVTASNGAIINPGEATMMNWSADCATIIMRIDRALLERELSRMLGGTLVRNLSFDLAIPCHGRDAQIWSLTKLLVNELETVPNACHLHTTNLYTSILLTSLLEHHSSNFHSQVTCRTTAIAPRHVRVVEEFMEANADKDLSLADLIAVSGVSGRALHAGFRKFRGISPIAHLRLVRMQRVRQRLEIAQPGETVTDIAIQWGFYQLGRFSAQYQKIFGEYPSETLRNRRVGLG